MRHQTGHRPASEAEGPGHEMTESAARKARMVTQSFALHERANCAVSPYVGPIVFFLSSVRANCHNVSSTMNVIMTVQDGGVRDGQIGGARASSPPVTLSVNDRPTAH